MIDARYRTATGRRSPRAESAALLVAVVLAGCFQDDGLIDPRNPPREPLAKFVGGGIDLRASDTGGHEARLLALTDPKIALVWQFLGPKEFVRAPSSAVVNAKAPYDFSVAMWDPPAGVVLDNPDVAIGQFWLYCDRNGNGILDRLIHPGMVPIQARIDTLYRAYNDAVEDLLASAEVREKAEEVSETLYAGAFGTMTIRHGDREDTLYAGRTPQDLQLGPGSTVHTRIRVLTHQNKWDQFFSLRKRDNERYYTTREAPGYVYAADVPYRRRVFPRPGQERVFEEKFRRIVAALSDYIQISSALLADAARKGYQNYPYDGDAEAGEDFVTARSRAHFVVYLKDGKALADLLAGERSSSFQVKGLERLKTGYNLITCDDQYRCEALPPDSPIRLDLGKTDAFFNPVATSAKPPAPMAAPVPPAPVPPSASALARIAGAYAYLPGSPLHFAEHAGTLWADHLEEGLVRLWPKDSLGYYTSLRPLQFQFSADGEGGIRKVFAFRGSLRYVGVRDSGLPAGDLGRRVEALLAPRSHPQPLARAQALAALRFDYGGDTLLLAEPAEDSLRVTVPGMFPQRMDFLDSSALVSRSLDLRIVFASDAAGKCPGAWVERGGIRRFAPALGYAAPGPRDLFPGLPDTLPDTVSAHAGSGRDGLPTLDGLPRFAHAGDSAFLRAGDGWVDSLGAAEGGFFPGRGGDFLRLRVPGLRGKAVAIAVTVQPERGAGARRVRFAARGGASATRQDEPLGAEAWADFKDGPIILTIGPFRAGADPYYVRLEQVPTADKPVAYAFGGYLAVTE